jgi:hypothetical protein
MIICSSTKSWFAYQQNHDFKPIQLNKVRCSRDRIRIVHVVGFTTTYAISAYHHWCCEFASRPGRGI